MIMKTKSLHYVTLIAPFLLLGVFMLQPKKKEVVIGFTGDVMLGRLVNEVINKKGYAYPWGDMIPNLKENDLNIINLETTLTRSDKKVPKVFNFKATPDKVKSLLLASIDVANLANNHAKDFSEQGLIETIETLDAAGIKHVGAGNNTQAAREPVIIIKNGIRIGILGFTDNEPGWKAENNKPGTNYFKVGDIEKVKLDVAQVRAKVDILIATQHWGPNKREVPTQAFVDFAHSMIDAGIDIIHGHSAHVTQGIEVYSGGLILYDTGDFVDDYMVGPMLRNDHSFLFRVTVTKQGVKKLTLIPVIINNMQVNLAQGKDFREMSDRIMRLSKAFGTKLYETDETLHLDVI